LLNPGTEEETRDTSLWRNICQGGSPEMDFLFLFGTSIVGFLAAVSWVACVTERDHGNWLVDCIVSIIPPGILNWKM